MTGPAQRQLRADAARNVDRIITAGSEVFTEQGPDAQMDGVAKRAGVASATLYRHFANKDVLVQAIVRRRFEQDVDPVMKRALANPDPWQAMVMVMEVVLEAAGNDGAVFSAARSPDVFYELSAQLFDSFATVLKRAQREGVVRDDLLPEDLPRLITMLIGAQHLGDDPGTLFLDLDATHARRVWPDAWRRYLALILDALRPTAATPLPPFGE